MRLRFPKKRFVRRFALPAICLCLFVGQTSAQNASPKDVQKLGRSILKEIKNTLKKEYYDPDFHGIDLDQRFKTAEERIRTLQTYPQVYRAIAQVVIEFNDSHTNFFPPRMSKTVDYGFTWQMIGSRCYVTGVTPGSDAEHKGLKVGDVITGMGNYNPTRENLWLITYLWYRLDPQQRLKVFVELPNGLERELFIESRVIETKDVVRAGVKSDQKPYRCEELNIDVMACKLYTFNVETAVIDEMMKPIRKHTKLILDLRGNSGGHVATELYLTGYFFDHNVEVAEEVRRRSKEVRIAKTHKDKAFKGDLIVLIDSKSMSASEVFARVAQLEKRARIIGDVSAGRVRTSIYFPLLASEGDVPFGLSVTIADLLMTDGKSLEGVGVIPDEVVGPTAKGLAAGTDPVLSYAASILGAQLTADEAGKLNFLRPPLTVESN